MTLVTYYVRHPRAARQQTSVLDPYPWTILNVGAKMLSLWLQTSCHSGKQVPSLSLVYSWFSLTVRTDILGQTLVQVMDEDRAHNTTLAAFVPALVWILVTNSSPIYRTTPTVRIAIGTERIRSLLRESVPEGTAHQSPHESPREGHTESTLMRKVDHGLQFSIVGHQTRTANSQSLRPPHRRHPYPGLAVPVIAAGRGLSPLASFIIGHVKQREPRKRMLAGLSLTTNKKQ